MSCWMIQKDLQRRNYFTCSNNQRRRGRDQQIPRSHLTFHKLVFLKTKFNLTAGPCPTNYGNNSETHDTWRRCIKPINSDHNEEHTYTPAAEIRSDKHCWAVWPRGFDEWCICLWVQNTDVSCQLTIQESCINDGWFAVFNKSNTCQHRELLCLHASTRTVKEVELPFGPTVFLERAGINRPGELEEVRARTARTKYKAMSKAQMPQCCCGSRRVNTEGKVFNSTDEWMMWMTQTCTHLHKDPQLGEIFFSS